MDLFKAINLAINKPNKMFINYYISRRRSVFTIENATQYDSGTYECRAKNKFHKYPVSKTTNIEVIVTPSK